MRYSAEYITKEAHDIACEKGGEYWPDHIEYGVVTGKDLMKVIAKACSLNYIDSQYCYFICFEEFNKLIGQWEDTEHYNVDGSFDYD